LEKGWRLPAEPKRKYDAAKEDPKNRLKTEGGGRLSPGRGGKGKKMEGWKKNPQIGTRKKKRLRKK